MLPADIPTRADLEALLRHRAPASISLYVPTTPVTTEIAAARIEFRNLASAAVARVASLGARGDDALVAEHLDAIAEDEDFWAHQARTLAVFATTAGARTFRLPNRLVARSHVADRFQVKPLLRSVTFPQAAFLLVLSGGAVRLLEVAPDLPTADIAVPDLPADAADAVGKASIADRSPSGRIQGAEGMKVRLAQYARRVDQAIRPVLAGQELPLILAAPRPLDDIYRSVNTYPGLLDEGIAGSHEGTGDAELTGRAREVLDASHARQLTGERDRFEARGAQGRTALDLGDIARAATFGAVDTVFVDIDAFVPGSIDPESGRLDLEATDGDEAYGVVDEIARRVLLSGGRVLAVRADDIPGGRPAAAILRFPV